MPEQYLEEGLDPTSLTSLNASQVLQMVREAKPTGAYGFIVYSTTAPAVGTDAELANFIWVDTSASPYTPKIYESGSWNPISLATSAITTAMIQNNAVTLAKLTATGVNALQVIRRNAGNTAYEFVDPADLFGANSIATTVVDVSAFTAGNFLVVSGGVISEVTLNALNYLADDAITPAKVVHPGTAYMVLLSDGSKVPAWGLLTNNHLPNDILGSKIADGSLSPAKLTSTPGAYTSLSTPLYANREDTTDGDNLSSGIASAWAIESGGGTNFVNTGVQWSANGTALTDIYMQSYTLVQADLDVGTGGGTAIDDVNEFYVLVQFGEDAHAAGIAYYDGNVAGWVPVAHTKGEIQNSAFVNTMWIPRTETGQLRLKIWSKDSVLNGDVGFKILGIK